MSPGLSVHPPKLIDALDLMPAMIRDLKGRIIEWSSGAESLYGWSRAQALDQQADVLLATRSPQPLSEVEADLIRTDHWQGHLHRRTRDGRDIWVASNWLLQREAGSALILEVSSDITSLKKQEDAHARLSIVADGSDDAIIARDFSGKATAWNRAAETMFGYTAREIIGQPFSLLIPTSLLADEASILERLRRGEKIDHYRTMRRRKDGTIFPVSITMSPTRDDEGRITGALKIVRDLSQDEEAKQQLEMGDALVHSVLETVPDGLVIIDENGAIRSFSQTAEQLFGFLRDEVIGHNVSMLMPSPYCELHDTYLARYLSTGERRIIGIGRVVVGRRKDGSTFPMELVVGEVKHARGRLFTGFVRDLTERQDQEQRIHELQAELSHVSRLSDLGQMVSSLAHEVNQPLAAIRNYANAGRRLLEGGKYEPLASALDHIGGQTERAQQIIKGLREFVRKGKTEQRPEHLQKAIEAVSALALVGVGRKLKVEIRLHPDASYAIMDKIQIQQVLFNLIRNAVEAMVECEQQELMIDTADLGDSVEVKVTDTGPGLPEEVRAKLFQPFVTTKPNGMGVGLSICRSIIQAHGGELQAEDRPGGGTIFRFTLPSAESRVPA
ncbi:MAG TPA: PAS domain S-box protein [Acidobacteriaceae bacterium]|jgi:two-component system sensor kinase FixL|nr:PAS domain S-box protein [Acidobacteriaceae bacterium]